MDDFINKDFTLDTSENPIDNNQSFGEPQDSSLGISHSLGDSDGDSGGDYGVETGVLAKLSAFDNPLPFEGDDLIDFSNDYQRLQNSIYTELGFTSKIEEQCMQPIEKNGDIQVGAAVYNICKNVVSENITRLAQEQTLDRMSGLVCGKLQCNPNEMMDVYFSGESIIDDCGLQSPAERWEAFIDAYNYANENSETPLNDLISQDSNIEQANLSDNIEMGGNNQGKEISFTGMGICGMQCMHGCTSITTEDNQDATYAELSEYNS